MELDDVIDILHRYGFTMLTRWVHINYHDEFELDLHDDITEQNILDYYSGCWYGAYFFNELFSEKYGDDIRRRTYDGDVKNIKIYDINHSMEDHHFCTVEYCNNVCVLSTYGGVPELSIQFFTCLEFNELWDKISIDNDIDSYKTLFGIDETSYASFSNFSFETTNLYHVPSLMDLSKLDCDIHDLLSGDNKKHYELLTTNFLV